jgi:hypothetical protein
MFPVILGHAPMVVVGLDPHEIQIGEANTSFRLHQIGEPTDQRDRALQDHRLQTVVMIEMDVSGRHHQIMMFVRHLVEALGQLT